MSYLLVRTATGKACATWAVAALLAVAGAGTLSAQIAKSAPEPKVIVTVDNVPITTADLALAEEILGPRLTRVPQEMRQRVLLGLLIDRKLFSEVARAAKVTDMAAFKAQIAYFTEDALRDIYVTEVMGKDISQEAIRARYDAEVAKQPKSEEMRASHILVASEDEAKEIIKQLEGGSDFAELAKTKSTGPSAPRGGDLGFFTAESMVPEFSAAAQALKVGEISAPVKTQFGWHVIRLEEKRPRRPPSFESVEPNLRQLLLSEMVREKAGQMRAAASVEYKDPAFKPPGK